MENIILATPSGLFSCLPVWTCLRPKQEARSFSLVRGTGCLLGCRRASGAPRGRRSRSRPRPGPGVATCPPCPARPVPMTMHLMKPGRDRRIVFDRPLLQDPRFLKKTEEKGKNQNTNSVSTSSSAQPPPAVARFPGLASPQASISSATTVGVGRTPHLPSSRFQSLRRQRSPWAWPPPAGMTGRRRDALKIEAAVSERLLECSLIIHLI